MSGHVLSSVGGVHLHNYVNQMVRAMNEPSRLTQILKISCIRHRNTHLYIQRRLGVTTLTLQFIDGTKTADIFAVSTDIDIYRIWHGVCVLIMSPVMLRIPGIRVCCNRIPDGISITNFVKRSED